jgi:membrane protein YqaA with SNARE-associated domain
VAYMSDPGRLSIFLFVVIFALNLLPAFAPPTWTAMSFVGLAIPDINFLWIALVAAAAATCGRIALAKASYVLLRQRWLSEETRRNVDTIKAGIESRPVMAFSTVLGYALSPLPSNYLFIAYGLTSLPIAFVAMPFFAGRLLSYAFWLKTASTVGDRLDLDWFDSAYYFVGYFLLSQLLLVPIIYVFTQIDWHRLLTEKRLSWLRKPK